MSNNLVLVSFVCKNLNLWIISKTKAVRSMQWRKKYNSPLRDGFADKVYQTHLSSRSSHIADTHFDFCSDVHAHVSAVSHGCNRDQKHLFMLQQSLQCFFRLSMFPLHVNNMQLGFVSSCFDKAPAWDRMYIFNLMTCITQLTDVLHSTCVAF